MKKIAVILIASSIMHNMQAEQQPTPTIIESHQIAAPDSDLLETFDNVPGGDQPIQERPLPWYLDVIQKPAAAILINACHSWDWACEHYADIRTRVITWWCTKKIRDTRTQIQDA